MKLTIILISVLCLVSFALANSVGNKPPDQRFVSNAIIRQLFEMFRRIMRTGDIQNEVPIMDPFTFNYKEICFSNRIFKINVKMNKGTLTGLSQFKLDSYDFNKSNVSIVEMDLRFPHLFLEAESYEMSGTLLHIFPLAGKGLFRLELSDVHILTTVYLKQSNDSKSILLDEFENTLFSVGKIISNTEFDGNIDEILNLMIEDLLADYFNELNGIFIDSIMDRIIQFVNPILDKYETWRLLAIIL